jgi:GNAT superfamily N-acetyltransferase
MGYGRDHPLPSKDAPFGEVVYERRHEDALVSTDRDRLDIDVIQRFLARSYWAEGIPRSVVERAVRHSLCFGLYLGGAQVGFARVVTDRATFAYLADVFVLEENRGRGLSKWLMACVVGHPDLQGLRRFSLATRDAHGLYQRFGFAALSHPDRHMEIARPDVYVEGGKTR